MSVLFLLGSAGLVVAFTHTWTMGEGDRKSRFVGSMRF